MEVIAIDKLERMQKEVVMPSFVALFVIWLDMVKERTRNLYDGVEI
jgi:hypothetical protein